MAIGPSQMWSASAAAKSMAPSTAPMGGRVAQRGGRQHVGRGQHDANAPLLLRALR